MCHLHLLDLRNLNLLRGDLVQPAEIRLPADGDNAREHAAELGRDVHEAECRDGGPEFAAVDETRGESYLQTLECLSQSSACEERVEAEEVGVEDGGED